MTKAVQGIDPATGQPIIIHIEAGRIAAIEPGNSDEKLYLSPGLIDLQVNGYSGLDLNSGALVPTEVVALADLLVSHGVTTFLPTLITASEDTIVNGLRAIAEARRISARARHMIPMVHVEGPSISPEDGPRGAHPREHVRSPDLNEFRRWQAAGEGLVGLVTLSPQWPDTTQYIAALASEGVHVSIGHTSASPHEIRAATAAGARLSTHLGNGAAANLQRHPNLIWTQLDLDALTATFIADGHHLPADTFRVMLRAKGLDHAILVSDVVALGGLPPGRYTSPIGGAVDVIENGRINVAGTPYLAGAGSTLDVDVAIAAQMTGLPLAEILPLATRNPGQFVGGRGLLEPGAAADLIRFRWQPGDAILDLAEVFLAGERVLP